MVVAQLGWQEADLRRQYGAPTSERTDAENRRILSFQLENGSVEAGLVGGLVRRVSLRQSEWNNHQVQALLNRNREDFQWAEWTVPGMPRASGQASEWQRSDDGAMARLAGTTLTITHAAWFNAPASDADALATQPATDAVAAPADATANTASVEALAQAYQGIWQAHANPGKEIFLAVTPHGTGTWLECAGPDYEPIAFRIKPRPTGEVWLWITGDEPLASLPPAGLLHLNDNGALSFQATPAHLAAGYAQNLVFQRAAAIPPPPPAEPFRLPDPGESRASIIERYGPPLGTMQIGKREILRYDWGELILIQGRHAQATLRSVAH